MKAQLAWGDPSQRVDGSSLPQSAIAFIDVQMSADNGQNYASVGHAAAGQQSFQQDLTDPGTYLFKFVVFDTQTPPHHSADSAVVSVTVPLPELAAPNTVDNPTATLVP